MASEDFHMIWHMVSARGIYWGLTHDRDMPEVFAKAKADYERTAAEAIPYGFDVPESFQFGSPQDARSRYTEFTPLTPGAIFRLDSSQENHLASFVNDKTIFRDEKRFMRDYLKFRLNSVDIEAGKNFDAIAAHLSTRTS